MKQLQTQLREVFWFVLLAMAFLTPWTFLMGTLMKVQTHFNGRIAPVDGAVRITFLMIVWLAYRIALRIVHQQCPQSATH